MQLLTPGNLLASILQIGVVAAAAVTVLGMLRIRDPRIRYATWRVLLLAGIVMPFAQPWPVTTTVLTGAESYFDVAVSAKAGRSALAATFAGWAGRALLIVLTLGCAGRLFWIAAGMRRLRRHLRATGQPSQCTTVKAVQGELGTRADVRFGDSVRQPATYGWWRPVVLLPTRLRLEDPAIVRAVLVHELLHVKRCDWPVLVVEEVLRAVYWFNPVVWWLVDRVQLAREEVVDAAAVDLAGGRRSYVRALLSCADMPLIPGAPAFADRRHLFTRITRLYEESTMSTRRTAAAAVLLAVCTTAAGAAAVTAFPISGGEEYLVVRAPEPVTAVVQDPPPPPPPPPPPAPVAKKQLPPPPPPPPPPPARADERVVKKRVPKLIYEVKPKYPSEAMDSNVQGSVEMEVTIGKDGTVTSARVLRPGPEPSTFEKALEDAAIEAVKQWRFEPMDSPTTTTCEMTFTLRKGPPKKR